MDMYKNITENYDIQTALSLQNHQKTHKEVKGYLCYKPIICCKVAHGV